MPVELFVTGTGIFGKNTGGTGTDTGIFRICVFVVVFFCPRYVKKIPRAKKHDIKTKLRSRVAYSMQFPRWMATEIRWNRNPVSLVSPDNADSRLQMS